jgi:hypothetical protein
MPYDMELINNAHRRFHKTLKFLNENLPVGTRLLDLGTPNQLSTQMKKMGYDVLNTNGEDFNIDYKQVIEKYDVDCYTSFEVFEHLFAPYNFLKEIPKGKMVCSVPLKVWFAKAYWNKNNEWDRHYHEFEPRQFDWLLEKTGWVIKKREVWASPDKIRLGIRPLLRFIFPSYYFVYAEKGL